MIKKMNRGHLLKTKQWASFIKQITHQFVMKEI